MRQLRLTFPFLIALLLLFVLRTATASPASRYVNLQLKTLAAAPTLAGVTFLEFMPPQGYLVRLPTDARAILAHPAVLSADSILPQQKVSPILAAKTTQSEFAITVAPYRDIAADNLVPEATGVGMVVERVDEGMLHGTISAENLHSLAAIPDVMWIQNRATFQEFNDDASWLSQSGKQNVTSLYDNGITGIGQVGAVADSGMAVFDFLGDGYPMSRFFTDDSGGPIAEPSLTHRKVLTYYIPAGADADKRDASGHGSHVVGTLVGDNGTWQQHDPYDGIAYAAQVHFQDIGRNAVSPEFPLGLINPPEDFGDLFAAAYDPNGDGLYQPESEPRTHSNSWGGTEHVYNLQTAQTDAFMWNHPDFLILYAAGNQNQGSLGVPMGYPAIAKNIVTVGATENGFAVPNNMASFSTHGPATNGRMKPTVSAPGDRVRSVERGTENGTVHKSGTSMSTPATHAIALLMRQYLWDGYYPTGEPNVANRIHPSAALLKALLMNSAVPIDGLYTDSLVGGSWPSNGQGWGRISAENTLYFPGDRRNLWLHDEYALDGSVGFDGMGQSRTFTLTVAKGDPFPPQPLAIHLVWTDFASASIANGALVNNLNLVVTDPSGADHFGNDPLTNDFNGVPDLPVVRPDTINPWEGVYLANPDSGIYTVTVTAGNLGSLVLDSRKQGFALVASADLQGAGSPVPSTPRISFAYDHYDVGSPQTTVVRVVDLAANTNHLETEIVSATVGGQAIQLVETTSDSGVFTATVTLDESLGTVVTAQYGAAAHAQARLNGIPINQINPSTVAVPTDTLDGQFALNWTVPESAENLSHYVVQETAIFTQPLTEDAENGFGNWILTSDNADWTVDGAYKTSGTNSFWSGRGDDFQFVNRSLEWIRPITIPNTFTSARLTYNSRYFNYLNDSGFIEISLDDGATWQMVEEEYAATYAQVPDAAPTTRMQFRSIDLSNYIDQPFRLRFRFDNMQASIAPGAPGWWLDDMQIEAGQWRTFAVVEARTLAVSASSSGELAYRVQAVYEDGTATAFSDAVTATVNVIPTAITLTTTQSAQFSLNFVLIPLLFTVALFTTYSFLTRRYRPI